MSINQGSRNINYDSICKIGGEPFLVSVSLAFIFSTTKKNSAIYIDLRSLQLLNKYPIH